VIFDRKLKRLHFKAPTDWLSVHRRISQKLIMAPASELNFLHNLCLLAKYQTQHGQLYSGIHGKTENCLNVETGTKAAINCHLVEQSCLLIFD